MSDDEPTRRRAYVASGVGALLATVLLMACGLSGSGGDEVPGPPYTAVTTTAPTTTSTTEASPEVSLVPPASVDNTQPGA